MGPENIAKIEEVIEIKAEKQKLIDVCIELEAENILLLDTLEQMEKL